MEQKTGTKKLSFLSKLCFGIGAFGKDAVYAIVGTWHKHEEHIGVRHIVAREQAFKGLVARVGEVIDIVVRFPAALELVAACNRKVVPCLVVALHKAFTLEVAEICLCIRAGSFGKSEMLKLEVIQSDNVGAAECVAEGYN